MCAEGAIGDIGSELLQALGIGGAGQPINKALANLGESARADATRDRLAARLIGAPARQHGGELWDGDGVVECEECARADVLSLIHI